MTWTWITIIAAFTVWFGAGVLQLPGALYWIVLPLLIVLSRILMVLDRRRV